jgi:hypothetical protein
MTPASFKKLAAAAGTTLTTLLHEDKAAGLYLVLDEKLRPHLLDGKAPVAGVTFTTEKRDSFHYSEPLIAVPDVAAWLGDADRVDERQMAWMGWGYREAVRYGRRVLFLWGTNNARNLQTIGLTFETEDAARRFFTSFATVLPKRYVLTGPAYVPGDGGVAREYFPAKSPGLQKGLGHVLDETAFWTEQFGNDRRERRETFASHDEAMRAFSQWELDWYRAGGRPYEIEYMERLKRRADQTLVEHADQELQHAKDQQAFVRKLLTDAGLAFPELPTDLAGLLGVVRSLHPAHWLLVGQRATPEAEVVHHAVMNKQGVHVYFDRPHRVVAVVEIDERRDRAWAKVTRADDEKKADAAWTKTLKRFKL